MTDSQILEKAKALIDTPEKWTTDTLARNADDVPVLVQDPSACKFCTLGAFNREGYSVWGSTAGSKLREASAEAGFIGPTDMNDSLQHPQVMAVWDRAIQMAKEEEACHPAN